MTPFAVGAFGTGALLGAAASLGRCNSNRRISLLFVGDADSSRPDRCFQYRRFVRALDADSYGHNDCFDTVDANVETAASHPLREPTLPMSSVCVPQDCVDGTPLLLAELCRLVVSVSGVAAPADPSICAGLDAVKW